MLRHGREAEKELDTAKEVQSYLAQARKAFLDGDAAMTRRWFRLAELAVAMADPKFPGLSALE